MIINDKTIETFQINLFQSVSYCVKKTNFGLLVKQYIYNVLHKKTVFQ